MCGNGGRCIVKFAHDINLIDEHAMFLAVDGIHEASIDKDGIVSLEMNDVDALIKIDNSTCELNTGSPHYVSFVNDVSALDVFKSGREIRYNDAYSKDGINVNFVAIDGEHLKIRTYERGVENETLSCGTGVTAAAIAAFNLGLIKSKLVTVKAMGGDLTVAFECNEDKFTNVVLSGPANKAFEGTIEL
jgi:diaminopimelate epimerase